MCVCVCGAVCLSWGTLIRSTLTANRDGAPQPQTSGTHKMTVDEEKRKCSFIHSFPTSVYTCVCVFAAVSVFSDTHIQCVCMCLGLCLPCEYSSLAGVWSHWQLHYGLCAQGDSTIQGKERRGQRHGTGQVYCWAAPRQSSSWWREGGGRGQLLSPLMSLCFFHQLSIYRAVQCSCTAHPHAHLCNTHTQFEAVLFLAGESQE